MNQKVFLNALSSLQHTSQFYFDLPHHHDHNPPMISSDIAKYLAQCGHQAPSADNSQPWHFVWDGTKLTVQYDAKRVQGKTFVAKSPATLLSLGATIENILEISKHYKISSDLIFDISKLSTTNASAEFTFDHNQLSEPVIPDAKHPLFNRHTNRFPYQKTVLPQDIVDHLSTFTENNAKITVCDQKPFIQNIAQLIKLASEIRFQTQEVHEWLGESLRFSKEDVKKADGLDIRTLDLPPGGSIFLKFISSWKRMQWFNKIGGYKLLAAIDSTPIKIAPAIISVIAPNTHQGSLDA